MQGKQQRKVESTYKFSHIIRDQLGEIMLEGRSRKKEDHYWLYFVILSEVNSLYDFQQIFNYVKENGSWKTRDEIYKKMVMTRVLNG